MATLVQQTDKPQLRRGTNGQYSGIPPALKRSGYVIPRPSTAAQTAGVWSLNYASSHPPHDECTRMGLPALPPSCLDLHQFDGIYTGTDVAWFVLSPLERLAILLNWGHDWPEVPPNSKHEEPLHLSTLDWFTRDDTGDLQALVDRTHEATAAVIDASAPLDAVEAAGQADYVAAKDPMSYPEAVKAASSTATDVLASVDVPPQERVPMDEEAALRSTAYKERLHDPGGPATRWQNEWFEPAANGTWVLQREDTSGRCAYRGFRASPEGEFLPWRDWERPYYMRSRCGYRLSTCGHKSEWSWHASLAAQSQPEPVQPLTYTDQAPEAAMFSVGQTVTIDPRWGGKMANRCGVVKGFSSDGHYVIVGIGDTVTLQVLPQRVQPATATTPHRQRGAGLPRLTSKERHLEAAVGDDVHTVLQRYQKSGETCPVPPTFPLLFYNLPYNSAVAAEWERSKTPTAQCRAFRKARGRPLGRPRKLPYPGCEFLYPRPWGKPVWEPGADHVWGEEWLEQCGSPQAVKRWLETCAEPVTWWETNWPVTEFSFRFPWGIPRRLIPAWKRWVAGVTDDSQAVAHRQVWMQHTHDQVPYRIAEMAAQQRALAEARVALNEARTRWGNMLRPTGGQERRGRQRPLSAQSKQVQERIGILHCLYPYVLIPAPDDDSLDACFDRVQLVRSMEVPAPEDLWPEETGLWVSTKEAARILGVSEGRVRAWRKGLAERVKVDQGRYGTRGAATRLDAVLQYYSDSKRRAHRPKGHRAP